MGEASSPQNQPENEGAPRGVVVEVCELMAFLKCLNDLAVLLLQYEWYLAVVLNFPLCCASLHDSRLWLDQGASPPGGSARSQFRGCCVRV
jgi:hypothetical protein